MAGDAIIHIDQVELNALVYNWGGAPSSPTELVIAVNDQPDWSVSNVWLGSAEVPAIDPRSGIGFTFTAELSDFSPGQDYYAIIQVEEIAEGASRTRLHQPGLHRLFAGQGGPHHRSVPAGPKRARGCGGQPRTR